MIRKALTVVAVASLATFGIAGPAAADKTAAVDKAEFDLVKVGHTLGYVNSVFDSLGTQTSSRTSGTSKTQTRAWDTVYGDYGTVTLNFVAKNGTWVVTSKHVYWDRDAERTANKAVKSEYDAVKIGMSIADVRKKFGTAGTVTAQYQSKSSIYADLSWPVEDEYGSVDVDFKWSNGTYRVISKLAYWGSDIVDTANKATKAEYDKVPLGTSIADVRKTFGTAGTVTAHYQDSSTVYAAVSWPTEDADGWVDVEFEWSQGTYRATTKSALWTFDPVPTADTATQSEYAKVTMGMSITDVRKTFGTSGTVVYQHHGNGTLAADVSWPTDSAYGWVNVEFEWSNGTYRVVAKDAYWGI
ncbi:hypothetical protein [Demequina sp. NBRC 110053]|uniref:hypothetical protein n=1 Tax=Demequina sp. NBRC 110053 TaxID=1570342 RepID=UPI0009FFFDAA|nr:hypothetical protein [Demequina sp. NBRC 110053]